MDKFQRGRSGSLLPICPKSELSGRDPVVAVSPAAIAFSHSDCSGLIKMPLDVVLLAPQFPIGRIRHLRGSKKAYGCSHHADPFSGICSEPYQKIAFDFHVRPVTCGPWQGRKLIVGMNMPDNNTTECGKRADSSTIYRSLSALTFCCPVDKR